MNVPEESGAQGSNTVQGWTQGLFDYARQKNALAFVHYAVTAGDNLARREEHARNLKEMAAKHFAELEEKALTNSLNMIALVPTTKAFHYIVLELIEKIAVLSETLFTTLSVMKRDFRRLPFAVLSRISPWQEVAWAKRARKGELKALFQIPRPSQILSTREERLVLKKLLEASTRRIALSIKGTALFYRRYSQIFNKYKHTISEHVGCAELGEFNGKKTLSSIIYFEDYPPPVRSRGGKGRRRPKPVTWGVVAGRELLEYLGEVLVHVTALHLLLLATPLNYLYNQGQPFVPPIGGFLNHEELKELRNCLATRTSFRSIGQFNMRTDFRWDPRLRSKAERIAAKRFWVFKLSRHIISGKKAISMANIVANQG